MGTKQIGWRRAINELRYLYNEFELIEEVVDLSGPAFLQYYSRFCEKHNITVPHPMPEIADEESTEVSVRKEAAGWEEEQPKTYLNDEFGNIKEVEDHSEAPGEEDELHRAFTKVFRALALYFHPDRLGQDATFEEQQAKLDMFKTANNCLEEKQYFKLMELAERYKIDLPENLEDHVDWIYHEQHKVRGEIQRVKSTFNYQFSGCETDESKDNLIKTFLAQLFDIQV